MSLQIDFESAGFGAPFSQTNGTGVLTTSWDELLWAALTVGRPNRQYVFRHGASSGYEALFRLSLVRMALEQAGPTARRLRRTPAARTLDPSEKGAVNYFLGLAVAKLFAAKCLDVPWLLHLDLFRPQLNAVLAGRSRPDLVGVDIAGRWIALECKGRLSKPSVDAKHKAKVQATRVLSVNGQAPAACVGAITYFRKDILQFYWQDPNPEPEKIKRPVRLDVPPQSWREPYLPVLELIETVQGRAVLATEPAFVRIENADISVAIHPLVLRALATDRFENSRSTILSQVPAEPSGRFKFQRDGVAVIAGESWLKRFEEASRQDYGQTE